MATTKHTLRAEYPLAGADDGLPVEIRFTYSRGSPDYWNKAGGHWEQGYAADVEYSSVMPLCPEPVPTVIRAAIEHWADGYLTDDEGYGLACDKALDDREGERERAMEYRREA